MKKINNYFSHDFNARNDIKLKKLNMQMGLEGIGLYWCIIERLYENNGYLTLDEDVDLLAYELRIKRTKIEKVLNGFDLFAQQNEIFYSPSVLKRLEKITNKSKKNQENARKRWEKDDANALPNTCEDDANASPNADTFAMQSECYIKEKKRNINNSSYSYYYNNNNNYNIYNFIEQEFARSLSPTEYEKIEYWLKNIPEDLFKEAIKISKLHGNTTFAYVDGILKNWKAQGIKSIEDINKNGIRGSDDKTVELFDYDWINESEDNQ